VREVLPSQANFLTVRFVDADDANRRLQAAGIVVRDVRRHPQLGDALRITLGTPEENARVLAALRRPLASRRPDVPVPGACA
jgi:histidinol-phosphate aminotransferase